MRCKIADLGVEVPAVGDLEMRCRPYLADVSADIVLAKEDVCQTWYDTLSEEENIYLISGTAFYKQLLRFRGMMLHASAVVVDGKAFLFSGQSGMGKSTHTNKYLGRFPGSFILNDDKPALRFADGRWMAYGTPWAGSKGINVNTCAPLAGICFLQRGDGAIRRLTPPEAVANLLSQTTLRYDKEKSTLLMDTIGSLVSEIPIFEFTNHAEDGDETVTYHAMVQAYRERIS